MSDINWAVQARLCLRREADETAGTAAWDRPVAAGSLGEMVCEAMSRSAAEQPWLVIECGRPVRFIPFTMIRTLWKLPDCPVEL